MIDTVPRRTSSGGFGFISRGSGPSRQFLVQWNAGWQRLNLIGGHKHADETYRECAIRELCEELLLEPGDLDVGLSPRGHFELTEWSRKALEWTDYTFELFDTTFREARQLDEIANRSENAWVTVEEVVSGVAHDGRPVSPTMRRLLGEMGFVGPVVDGVTAGVTGHRRYLDSPESLKPRILAALGDLEPAEPDDSTKVFLSPLAAGADQLVAECALERCWELVVPLPMPVELYEQDFSAAELGTFRRLLARARSWFVVPWPEGLTVENVAAGGEQRNLAYYLVGEFISQRATALVTLWDGKCEFKVGGTADILRTTITGYQNTCPRRIAWVRVRRE